VKLLVRTTRRISLTHEGSAFLEDCQRLLSDVANAEASVSAGGVKATGHLRITAPAGFGAAMWRRWCRVSRLHPEVTISLNLSDRVVDLAGEGYDCAVRVGDLPDSSLVSVRMADNRRLCVATPAYLARHGTPRHPAGAARLPDAVQRCLADAGLGLSHAAGQRQQRSGALQARRAAGLLRRQVLHDWCLGGWGMAWRSTWEVEAEIAAGRLVAVLEEFAAPPNGIYVVFPQRKHMPLRVRLWIDYLKMHYERPEFWREGESMTLEAVLAAIHIVAILTLVVF
jgi:DNA-binding transcriptional LysR family regulator